MNCITPQHSHNNPLLKAIESVGALGTEYRELTRNNEPMPDWVKALPKVCDLIQGFFQTKYCEGIELKTDQHTKLMIAVRVFMQENRPTKEISWPLCDAVFKMSPPEKHKNIPWSNERERVNQIWGELEGKYTLSRDKQWVSSAKKPAYPQTSEQKALEIHIRKTADECDFLLRGGGKTNIVSVKKHFKDYPRSILEKIIRENPPHLTNLDCALARLLRTRICLAKQHQMLEIIPEEIALVRQLFGRKESWKNLHETFYCTFISAAQFLTPKEFLSFYSSLDKQGKTSTKTHTILLSILVNLLKKPEGEDIDSEMITAAIQMSPPPNKKNAEWEQKYQQLMRSTSSEKPEGQRHQSEPTPEQVTVRKKLSEMRQLCQSLLSGSPKKDVLAYFRDNPTHSILLLNCNNDAHNAKTDSMLAYVLKQRIVLARKHELKDESDANIRSLKKLFERMQSWENPSEQSCLNLIIAAKYFPPAEFLKVYTHFHQKYFTSVKTHTVLLQTLADICEEIDISPEIRGAFEMNPPEWEKDEDWETQYRRCTTRLFRVTYEVT